MGQRRPDKHAAVAVRQVPADGPQPAAQRVAPRLVNRALGAYAVQRPGQRRNGCLLHRQKHAEIDLGPQFFAGGDNIRPADQKTDPRAGHVEGFGEREKLNRNLFGPRCVEDAAALGAVKDDIAVSVIMHKQDVIFLAEIHNFAVQFRRADAADRVCRQRDKHNLCLAGNFGRDGVHIRQEAVFPG